MFLHNMRGILVVKYPMPITSLKNNVKEFEMEASKTLFKREIAHIPTTFHPIEVFFHSLIPQCIKKRKSIPPIEVSMMEIEADLGGEFHCFGTF